MSANHMKDFSLEVYMSKWEFVAKYNLSGSDAQNMTLGELLALANDADRAAFDKLSLAYTETWGAPALREEIAGTYDGVDARDVLCFAGAEEGPGMPSSICAAATIYGCSATRCTAS